MGRLERGEWVTDRDALADSDGRFRRGTTTYRNWVTADGSPGSSGDGGFEAESGRYHLYISYACPWAHRTLISRAIKGLEPHVDVSVVHPLMQADGWTFDTSFAGATGDRLFGSRFLRDIYLRADPGASGRVTVPVLWDKARDTIVSNESGEIIRMFNTAFDGITSNRDDYFPKALRDEIEAVNERVYATLNNGVYRAGFATTQDAYNEAVAEVFETLDWLEERLSRQRYVAGVADQRGRLAAGGDAFPLRCSLSWALQVQPQAARRLSEPLGVCPRTLPAPGRRADRAVRPLHHALPPQPRQHQSAQDRADRAVAGLGRAARARTATGCLRS
jgi:glutathionyl-hydroquinone reductase